MGTVMLKLFTYNIHIYTDITYIQTKVDTNDTGSSPEGSTWGIQENHEKLKKITKNSTRFTNSE